jgi:hypothetical protein
VTDERPDQLPGLHNTRDLEVTQLNAFVQIEGAELA